MLRARSIFALILVLAAGALSAQSPPAQPTAKPFVPPGTPGSPINGELFHAQVLLTPHGFSPGVIDGKEGKSFKLALRSFQESRGLDANGKLDDATRRALLAGQPPVDGHGHARPGRRRAANMSIRSRRTRKSRPS